MSSQDCSHLWSEVLIAAKAFRRTIRPAFTVQPRKYRPARLETSSAGVKLNPLTVETVRLSWNRRSAELRGNPLWDAFSAEATTKAAG